MLHNLITCYRIYILKILPLNYMFYMFLIFMLIFILIEHYLPFDPLTHLLLIILNYKNLNSNNWLMTSLLIFDHLEILQVWRIYENNVI